jgi:alkyl hydroperoxide reductase subunit AhpC
VLEAPALAKIQQLYQRQGVEVIAINFEPDYSLEQWVGFWKGVGAGDVTWAQDTERLTPKLYRLIALGTEIIVDRQGRVTFRSNGPVGYDTLSKEIEKAL